MVEGADFAELAGLWDQRFRRHFQSQLQQPPCLHQVPSCCPCCCLEPHSYITLLTMLLLLLLLLLLLFYTGLLYIIHTTMLLLLLCSVPFCVIFVTKLPLG